MFPVFLDDRQSEVDRVVGVYQREQEARDEALRRNLAEIPLGKSPWEAPLYYVYTGRDFLGE